MFQAPDVGARGTGCGLFEDAPSHLLHVRVVRGSGVVCGRAQSTLLLPGVPWKLFRLR